MAKLIDPDSLTHVTNTTATTQQIEIQTGGKTIKLIANSPLLSTSPASESGVTGKCFYSKLKEIWESDNTLNRFKFPIQMIYEAQFIWINGWAPADATTRTLIRDAGFRENTLEEWACMISLGAMFDTSQQSHYTNSFTTEFNQAKIDFGYTGTLNENVQIKGTGGTPDTTSYFKAFLRAQGKTFASYNLLQEQGFSALTYQAYRLPLANATDINIIYDDTEITGDSGSESGVKYSELTIDYLVGNKFVSGGAVIAGNSGNVELDDVLQDGAGRWYRCTSAGTIDATDNNDLGTMGGAGTAVFEVYPGERSLDGGTTYYAFNRIIDAQDTTNGFSARLKELYCWTQYQLRQATNINDNVNLDAFGDVLGNVATDLLYWVGDKLHTYGGVYIDSYDANDVNDIRPHDITITSTYGNLAAGTGGLTTEYTPIVSNERSYPFTAAGTLEFNNALVDETDVDTRYTMYFEYFTSVTGSITLTASAGATGDITWASTLLDHIDAGDYLKISGFTTNPEDNGEYLVNSVGANTMNVTHQNSGVTVVTETASCTVLENAFETLGATIVNNKTVDSGNPISGDVVTASTAWDYDYTNNIQRGADGEGPNGTNVRNTDAPIVVVALAKNGAQYIASNFSIREATGQTFAITPADELNYSNPV